MLRDLFDVDFMDSVESDQRAADETVTMGLMRYAEQQVSRGLDERAAQTVVVAVTLGAGSLTFLITTTSRSSPISLLLPSRSVLCGFCCGEGSGCGAEFFPMTQPADKTFNARR
jgi:hypothetical protein